MAPELRFGEPASYSSDVYALGALLYVLCSERPPYPADVTGDPTRLAIAGEPLPLNEVAPHVDPRLAAIVDRCLRRDPGERYASGNELRAALAQLTPEARDPVVPDGNPYRGLRPFDAAHRGLYFGRDSEAREVLERLQSDAFVLVAGDSGVGKSSLCRAAVLPRAQSWFGGQREWRVTTMVPGRHPVRALAEALAGPLDMKPEDVERLGTHDPADLARRVSAASGERGGLVLLIDQLEELVTVAERSEMVVASEALAWLTAKTPTLRVLATARADFLGRLATLPRFGDAIPRALYFLRPLTEARLREAIVGPARAKGVEFEDDAMVEALVRSTQNAEGGLPLLQFTLAELWRTKPDRARILPSVALEALGGVEGALVRHADQVMSDMRPQDHNVARALMLMLVTGEGTRARRSARELEAGSQSQSVLDALVRGRLVVARETTEGAVYELAHEALARRWPTLVRWLAESLETRAVRERLTHAVAEWERLGKPKETLWEASQVREAASLEGVQLTQRETEFLSASRRRLRQRWSVRLGIAAAALSAVVGTYVAVSWRAEAERDAAVAGELRQATERIEQAKLAEKESQAKYALAIESFRLGKRDDAEARWSESTRASVAQRSSLALASERLETAMTLDPSRDDLHLLLADVLLARAEEAERRGDDSSMEESLARMRVHDLDGSRSARWNQPGRVSLETEPPNVHVELRRFQRASSVGSPEELEWPADVHSLELSPGSYLAVLSSEGRETVRVPFLVERGESVTLSVALPSSSSIPKGFLFIPEGTSFLGTRADDSLRRDFFHCSPLHRVQTPSFLIARNETTFGEWIEFLEALPPDQRARHTPGVEGDGFQGALSLVREGPAQWRLRIRPAAKLYEAASGEPIEYAARTMTRRQRWESMPVTGVTADSARAYAEWVSKTGRAPGARLCTEVEWERAARGADDRLYPHGWSIRGTEANFDATYGKDPNGMGLDAVGSWPSSDSPFGVQDMAGNAWEWTLGVMGDGDYVARGGSFYFGANAARIENRELPEALFRDVTVGFRVCADVPVSRLDLAGRTGAPNRRGL